MAKEKRERRENRGEKEEGCIKMRRWSGYRWKKCNEEQKVV